MKKAVTILGLILLFTGPANMLAQVNGFTAVQAEVDFAKKLRPWDGFGFNYVETAQTINYASDRQEYGGFSLLKEPDRQKILDMVFGEDGLKVGLLKMFYDPHHQSAAGSDLDHEASTQWIRYFAREGLKRTRSRGADLQIITTLYGPPPFVTQQNTMRGRDLNPAMKGALTNYLADWVKYLRDKEKLPVRYVSLHNEGEDWSRWDAEDKTGNIGTGHDYNMYWSPAQTAEFVKLTRAALDKAGLKEVGVTPGENTNWYRFSNWGYAYALADDPEALRNLGLITSHGFYVGSYGRWFGEHTSAGTDYLRERRPELHAWVTSTSWSQMDTKNVKEMHGNIYTAKVNGIIPWAGIQRPSQWVGGDPNPGSAFTVREDGSYEVRRGYYFYKQLTRAGQAGMAVARTSSMDSEMPIIAFAANGTRHPDAFVVTNMSAYNRKVVVSVKGTNARRFAAFRTTEKADRYQNVAYEQYQGIGDYNLTNEGTLLYDAPAGSVTTFFAK
ncbi:hypothetical protein GCM10023189_13180 [Nibrella saemangeumensis]|uniref:Glycosyl hydrolase family 30 beta sandwich domain-containing protein n=1 Tax=Nibrella saemangeumensis TaxID=1084526 RepID=A0ABP8ML36_9BACT